jgi:hypothetical protein
MQISEQLESLPGKIIDAMKALLAKSPAPAPVAAVPPPAPAAASPATPAPATPPVTAAAPAAPAAPAPVVIDFAAIQAENETLKTQLTTRNSELETERKKVTDFQAAVKEEGGKLSANILAKLGVAPISLKPDGSPATAADTKSLLAEYNESKPAVRNELLAKYGAYNIANNIRKPAGQS